MKKMILLLSLFTLLACQNKESEITIDYSNSQWYLVGGKDHGKDLSPIPNYPISLQMLPKKWIGTAGINHYQIPIQTLNHQEVKVLDSAITTRMAGNPQAMNMEYRYLNALGKVKKVDIKNHKLILSGEHIELIFKL